MKKGYKLSQSRKEHFKNIVCGLTKYSQLSVNRGNREGKLLRIREQKGRKTHKRSIQNIFISMRQKNRGLCKCSQAPYMVKFEYNFDQHLLFHR